MVINDQKLAQIIRNKTPILINGSNYYVVSQPNGSCDNCVFQLEPTCPQKAVTICTSNGGNILVKNKPQ